MGPANVYLLSVFFFSVQVESVKSVLLSLFHSSSRPCVTRGSCCCPASAINEFGYASCRSGRKSGKTGHTSAVRVAYEFLVEFLVEVNLQKERREGDATVALQSGGRLGVV